MVKSFEVSVKTDIAQSWVQGRNGLANIQEIRAWIGSNDIVCIEGLGKRNWINGGFGVTPEAMDELAQKWIEARGKR
jgi:hypothetical protein